jgi:VIT1/CCC1 family predicted Fe2+/Mn2+ transporter
MTQLAASTPPSTVLEPMPRRRLYVAALLVTFAFIAGAMWWITTFFFTIPNARGQ